jgi:hypothetical protein
LEFLQDYSRKSYRLSATLIRNSVNVSKLEALYLGKIMLSVETFYVNKFTSCS